MGIINHVSLKIRFRIYEKLIVHYSVILFWSEVWGVWAKRSKTEQVSVSAMETELGKKDSISLVDPDNLKNERVIVRMLSSHKLSI